MKKSLLLTALSVFFLATPAWAAEINVDQKNQQFSEDTIKLKAGDTIVFKNSDTVSHNIQVVNGDGDTDDKGLAKPGQDVKVTFAKAGEYKVRCGIHPSMKIKVTAE